MRIPGNSDKPARSSRTGSTGPAGEGNGPTGAGGATGEAAAHMNLNLPHLQGKLESLPEVRESRVEAIKDAIERGEYEVGGREVVDRILRNILLENLK